MTQLLFLRRLIVGGTEKQLFGNVKCLTVFFLDFILDGPLSEVSLRSRHVFFDKLSDNVLTQHVFVLNGVSTAVVESPRNITKVNFMCLDALSIFFRFSEVGKV